MATVTLPQTLTANTPENVNNLNSNLNALVAGVNNIATAQIGNAQITGNLIGTTLAQQLGITNAANTGRGKSIIASTEARSNVAYGTLTTPDQVTGIVLPTDGLIAIGFQATWQSSVGGAGNAAVFIGATQLKTVNTNGTNPVQEAVTAGSAAVDAPLAAQGGGLFAPAASSTTSDITTGQVLGAYNGGSIAGPCYVFAAAGTYTISVQFKASSGSVTAKQRKLWVWVVGF